MAAKLLHSLADENPDLQKQIGCMTGIFQLFDRHQILTTRRINQKRLPSGNSNFSDGSLERDPDNILHRQTQTDTNVNKGVNERQRLSTESSRASFSSCSSSVSSLDCKAEAEAPYDRIIFPETLSRDAVMNQSTICPHFGCNSLDLRDVVKDSMYREARGLSVKTTGKEESATNAAKRRDSPRPIQLTKSVDGSYRVGIDGKQSVPIDLKESIRVLAKLREAPWYYAETKELPKDAPWFRYEGKEISRLSFESRDTIKSTPKLKELPRHSLDSKEGSRNIYSGTFTSNDKVPTLQHPSATPSRPPSVVAKLMGLEALPPDSSLAGDAQSSSTETYSTQDNGQFPRSSKIGLTRPLRLSNSPKISLKDPTSPRRKNPDLVMKPISSSRVPIEPAPWKQQDGNRISQKPNLRGVKAPTRAPDSFPSVYSEIEKRLNDLEFQQSGRDLRALKQILEAMQEKGLLESRKEEQAPNVVGSQSDHEPKATNQNQNTRSVRQQNTQRNTFLSSTLKGSDSARAFESPIVIMKPAKLVEKTVIPASSVIPIGGHSGSQKQQNRGVYVDAKTCTSAIRVAKDQSPRNIHRDASASSTDKKTSSIKTTRSVQSQSRPQQLTKENSQSSVKQLGSVSPRLQQKKLELEKRSRPPAPPTDSNKPRRQPGKKVTESGSPGGRQRPKSLNLQQGDEQLSEISNESRSLSCQGDEISMQSDSLTVNSKMDMEVTSSLQTVEIDDSQSPSLKTVKQLISEAIQKRSTPSLDEDETVAELATDAPEQPSPVSVLDGSVYRDDVPSPVKQIYEDSKGDDAQESKEKESKENEIKDQWNPADSLSFNSTGSLEINRKKLQNIDHLVQKLQRLNSSHDEAKIDYIASLCENTNPDHRYISEILLASGLLLRDLSSELLTFQLHSSGYPINPELFLVLEQTKASSLLSKEESSAGRDSNTKLNKEKFHRKFIFDSVNEILGAKFGSSPEPWFQPNSNRLTKKTSSAQKLLKELCFEIETIQAKKSQCCLGDEDDSLKSMLCGDVMHGSESWTDFNGYLPGVVLDVERLIFKDLVDEVVIGESAGLRVKQLLRRRKLFGK